MGGFPGMSGEMLAGEAAQQMSRNALMVSSAVAVGDFHVYPLKNEITIVQEQMNRLLMLGSEKVTVRTDYSARPPEMYL